VGYQITRQTGSHLRLTTQQGGEHHITIPNHPDLRVGTLNAILGRIASHLNVQRQELVKLLFS
jgi:predicted RNA binding protein YcfA (HicA-like mRNA interferase family)